MTSSKAARDILEDHSVTFNCYQLSRGVRTRRPLSRRWVYAEQCLCTQDTTETCDTSKLYNITFYEASDEEAAKLQGDMEKYPDIPLDRIGVLHPDGEPNLVHVPSDFMDVLWGAAVEADGVLRSITLTVQPQKQEGTWAVFEVTLSEQIAEPFELPVDKSFRPKVSPPRASQMVVELQAVRAQLRALFWPGIATVAVGVLVALWIAKGWR
jgi:hypothetical protein